MTKDLILKITDKDKVYAVFIRDMSQINHSEFITEDDDEMQVGAFSYNAPHHVKMHKHNDISRSISRTQEFIYVQSGVMRVKIFNDEKLLLKEIDMDEGSGLVIFRGWHALDINDACKFFEVKHGPYLGLADKTYEE